MRNAAQQPATRAGAAIWAMVAACGVYFCMYMFRKPFTAGAYVHYSVFGMPYKPIQVIFQVLGYTISKFIGVKVVPEADPSQRIRLLLILIGIAELALVGFALVPFPYNLFLLFINGLPLGVVFGLVLRFLEGRRHTELLASGLCASFVFADGIAKSIGTSLHNAGISEAWMPAAAGALFIPAFLIFTWMLTRIEAPLAVDIEERSERLSLTQLDRKTLFRKLAWVLIPLVAMYALVGIVRGVRGDFAPEIWAGMRVKVAPSVFTTTEILAGSAALICFAVLSLIRSSRRAFQTGLVIAVVGCGLMLLSLVGFRSGGISPFEFMVLNGFGLYLPYFAVHTTLFDRLIAITRERGNIGYLMYVADASSYSGLVFVLFARNLTHPSPDSILPFFIGLIAVVGICGLVFLTPLALRFKQMGPEA